jgi:predicted O-linked N-acetylglucosamine transferase (SPINDLY family)
MGADFIDYLIADRVVAPPDQQPYYSEKIVYLPDTFQANDDRRTISVDAPLRAEAGLPENGLVFCCFNQNFKILPDVFDTWMRLLREIDGSVAWIQEGDPIAAVATYEQHLARFRLADLFLDTRPYNAHTMASDALWMGLPVVTCIGSTFASRVAASLLHAIGLPELVTTSLAAYEVLAIKLAKEPELLNAVKSKLDANRNTYPLFDTDRFRRHIESAYITMYERHRRGEPPESFTVEAIENK